MEFPKLGEHCFEKSCNRLDFLPLKCDACSHIFCIDHIQYSKHSCDLAYQKDVQVPVCPLCNKPVPSKRGEPPDIAVGQHIDNDCMSDPAMSKREVYTNRCSLKGCKQKEVVPLICSYCGQNYCVKHRHPVDHDCPPIRSGENALTATGAAAAAAAATKAQKARNNNKQTSKKFFGLFTRQGNGTNGPAGANKSSTEKQMADDEALATAMQNSFTHGTPISKLPQKIQEQEDRNLARAIAASEEEAALAAALGERAYFESIANSGRSHSEKERNCTVS